MFFLSCRAKRFYTFSVAMGWLKGFCHALLQLITPAEADSLCLQQNWFWTFQRDKPAVSAPCILDLVCPFVTHPSLTIWGFFLTPVIYQVKWFPVWAKNLEEGINFIIIFWFFRSWIFTAFHVLKVPRLTFPTVGTGSKVQILLIKDSFSEDWVVLCYCSSVKIQFCYSVEYDQL